MADRQYLSHDLKPGGTPECVLPLFLRSVAGIVHHTDAVREYAYDRQSKIGKLDKAWDEARAKGWTVVDMKQDWKTAFPSQQ